MRLTHGSDHPRLPTFLRSILPPGRQHDFLQVQGGRTEGNARRRKRRSASYCRWRAVGGSALPACGLSLLPATHEAHRIPKFCVQAAWFDMAALLGDPDGVA